MNKLQLHLGCGKRNFGEGWIHIDKADYPHINFKNVSILPFDTNTVDIIYACHLLEYFDREEALNVLQEWVRVLKVGGILRIAVPDFYAMCELYIKEGSLNKFLGPLYGKMFANDKKIYHKTTYDYISLRFLLNQVGIKNINLYDWRKTEHSQFDDHSQAYIPHMDKENGLLISLNVEGIKK